MVHKIEVSYVIFDDRFTEDDVHEIIDNAFNDAEVGYWILKESGETEISEEEAVEEAEKVAEGRS